MNKVHSLCKKARSFPSPQNLSNILSSESLLQADIAEAKLNYELHLVSRSNYSLPSLQDLPVINDVSISEITFSESDVYKVLVALDPNKAMGIDGGIGPNVLNYCALSLCGPSHHLFSLCVHLHSIPAEWHLHCIIPIFKSGDKFLIQNYRPISLLWYISKVQERLIYPPPFLIFSLVFSSTIPLFTSYFYF